MERVSLARTGMDNDEITSVLWIGRDVWVYKIPPLKANQGHRANDWGDLSKPLWRGRLRIVERDSGVSLQLEDTNTGERMYNYLLQHELVAPYDPADPSVEAVLDSSRYFVLRVEDSGKKAYIGIGYQDRSDSFDFNVALQDYAKRWKAKMNPQSPASTTTSSVSSGPKKDYSLKAGETFSINIPGRKKDESSLLGSQSSSSSLSSSGQKPTSGALPLLPPPPSSKR